jgi:hypothetical protein
MVSVCPSKPVSRSLPVTTVAVLGAVLLLLAPIPAPAQADDAVGVWQRWEHALTNDRDYPNPCTDVTVRVRFDGPQGQVRKGLGFWDGDRQFLIRCAFPTTGEWRWSTTCSDPANRGLHAQSGVVQVRPPTGRNPLTAHGYLIR